MKSHLHKCTKFLKLIGFLQLYKLIEQLLIYPTVNLTMYKSNLQSLFIKYFINMWDQEKTQMIASETH